MLKRHKLRTDTIHDGYCSDVYCNIQHTRSTTHCPTCKNKKIMNGGDKKEVRLKEIEHNQEVIFRLLNKLITAEMRSRVIGI